MEFCEECFKLEVRMLAERLNQEGYYIYEADDGCYTTLVYKDNNSYLVADVELGEIIDDNLVFEDDDIEFNIIEYLKEYLVGETEIRGDD